MRLEPDSPQRTGEQRRYFPDWECRLRVVCEEIEADHNSYLAGGYAEEFGYSAQSGASRGVPLLGGESPEESAEWKCQAAAMHPGYPIRPHPIVSDEGPQTETLDPIVSGSHTEASKQVALGLALDIAGQGGFISVADRAYERDRHRAAHRAAALVTRFAAAVFALRWTLPRRW
jgi:hypothetical protein